MKLYINGQDIKMIHFAWIEDDINVKTFDVDPDDFLKVFDSFLRDSNAEIDDIDELYIVIGPGSATALRTILAIVNTLHYTKGIKLFGIKKNRATKDSDVVEDIQKMKAEFVENDSYLFPIYERDTGVTISTKDA
ncbi:hypothetical protein KJ766_03115, partial [Patescibacteria group bacterium]|nr:hypothetical protein [Patescibacteria group bacterium]